MVGEPKVPKYQEIADEYRAKIQSGSLAAGARLPGERLLSEERGVAIETVRRAYRLLIQEGLIEQLHGKGTFVRAWKPIVRNIGKRMSAAVWGSGQSVWSAETEGRSYRDDTVRVEREAPPVRVAAFIADHAVWVRERQHFVDDRPVMLSASYYPATIADGSLIAEKNTGPGGSPARLAELGHAIAQNREHFRSRLPTPDERQQLALPPLGSTVVEIVRVSRDASGQVVEVTEMIASGDAYVFQFDYTS